MKNTKKPLDFSKTYIMLTNDTPDEDDRSFCATLVALDKISGFGFETVGSYYDLIMTTITGVVHEYDNIVSLDGHIIPIVDLAAASLDEFLLKAAVKNLLRTV